MRPRNKDTNNNPVTEARLIYFLEDMKDFVRSAIKGSETSLRKEFKSEIKTVHTAIGEHSKLITGLDKKVDGLDKKIDGVRTELKEEMNGMRTELKEEIKATEHRLSDKIDIVIDKVENHEVRITNLERGRITAA